MRWVRLFVIVLATAQAGLMAADGLQALIVGDYFTHRSGAYKVKLGPWASVVESVGIDPHSTSMKLTFVAYGVIWLLVIYQFARGRRWSRAGMILAAIGSLWCIGPGTPLAIAQLLVLMLLPPNRPAEVAA